MNKLFYVFIMGVCLFAACKKNKSNSVEDELINKAKADNPACTCDPYINKYEREGQVIYVQAVRGPACNSIPFFYNSKGERFEIPEGVSYGDFLADYTFIKEIWSCHEFKPL
jgi:hypothetical protein